MLNFTIFALSGHQTAKLTKNPATRQKNLHFFPSRSHRPFSRPSLPPPPSSTPSRPPLPPPASSLTPPLLAPPSLRHRPPPLPGSAVATTPCPPATVPLAPSPPHLSRSSLIYCYGACVREIHPPRRCALYGVGGMLAWQARQNWLTCHTTVPLAPQNAFLWGR